MKITVLTIPHAEQRYDTCGDWWFDNEGLQIRVSELGDPYQEFLVAFHEQAEAMLCLKRGIDEEVVSAFDKTFEEARDDLIKLWANHPLVQYLYEREPGDAPTAPYRKEHFTATNLERILAQELGVDWVKYETACVSLE